MLPPLLYNMLWVHVKKSNLQYNKHLSDRTDQIDRSNIAQS